MYNETITKLEQFTDIVEFERLCCDILSGLKYKGIEPQSTGRKDGGKDALLINEENKVVFHFSMREDWEKKMFEDLDTVKAMNKAFTNFVFVTNRATGGIKKDNLKQRVKTEYVMNLDIFDQERIRVELDNNRKDLREKYLKISKDSSIDTKIHEIYDEVKNGKEINFEALNKVAKEIIALQKEYKDSSGIQIPLDIKEKIQINKLSNTFEEILKAEMVNFHEIDNYLRSGLLNRQEMSKMLISLKLIYLKHKHSFDNGDQIFTAMLDEIKPKKCSDEDYGAYCALLCYFFHSCEVFESVVPR